MAEERREGLGGEIKDALGEACERFFFFPFERERGSEFFVFSKARASEQSKPSSLSPFSKTTTHQSAAPQPTWPARRGSAR